MSLNWDAKNAAGWDKIESHNKDTLIWGMMLYGINPITKDNAEEFYRRHVKDMIAQGLRPTLSLLDCENAAGLGSNASRISEAEFNKKLLASLNRTADSNVAMERRAAEAAARPLPEPEPEPERPTYSTETAWGDHLAGRPNVYTYTFSDGRVFTKEETKNIVTGGFQQKVYLTEGGKRRRSTLKELDAAKAGAVRAAPAEK